MKFIKLDLLTLLISLFILSSCESTATIGLEVDPTIAIEGKLVDSITISSRTVAENTGPTGGLVRHPLGFLKDATFGNTTSSLAMSVNLPNDAYDFGASPSLDSAILVLNYGSGFYGDTTSSTYSIDVHQLTNNLSTETSFLSNRTYPFNSVLLGNKTGRIYPTTRIRVTDVVTGAADTIRSATPQVRIRLDNNFVFNNIVNQPSGIKKYNAVFQDFFKGLHVQINKANSTGNGGMIFFDFAGSNSYLSLYFKRTNATTTTAIDTVNANFPIAVATNPIAASIQHDYAGTDIAAQLAADPKVQFSQTYLQPMGGVRNKIAFPFLKSFATNTGKMVINKAELVIDIATASDVAPYSAAPRLSLYRFDIANQRKNIPDNDAGTQVSAGDPRALSPTIFGGYFNTVTKQYIFVVTSYLQDLVDGKTQDYGTFLASTPLNEYEINPSMATAARVVLGAFKKSPAAADKVMKLNVYYTKVK